MWLIASQSDICPNLRFGHMTEIYEVGDSVMGKRLVVEARDIRLKRKPIMLYGSHKGQQAVAEGSARCYISRPISKIGRVTKT